MKLVSTYHISPYFVEGGEETLEALRDQLRVEKARQQAVLDANKDFEPNKRTLFGSADAKKMVLPDVPCDYGNLTNLSRWDRITKSEARRILSGHKERVAIAEFMEEHGYDFDYDNRPEELKYTKKAFWVNVQEAGKIPNFPSIKTPVLTLAQADSQYATLKHNEWGLELRMDTFVGKRTFKFQIAEKVWHQYRGFKVSLPFIKMDEDGTLVFMFPFVADVELPERSGRTVAADLGKNRLYAATIVDEEGNYVATTQSHSLELERILRKERILEEKLKLASEKNARRKKLGIVNQNAIREEELLREKIIRLHEAEDWQVGVYLVALAGHGGVIVLENLKWVKSNPSRFRYASITEKTEHIAAKRGVRTKKVSASCSSQTCPKCDARHDIGKKRIFDCPSCDYIGDRDETASKILAMRGTSKKKVREKKNRPTPKRPKPRKHFMRNLERKVGYTGPILTIATDGLEPVATIVDHQVSPKSTYESSVKLEE